MSEELVRIEDKAAAAVNPFREEIANTLTEYDKRSVSELAKIFRQACAVHDTNSFVRSEVEQVATLFQKLFEDYFKGEEDRKKFVADLQDQIKSMSISGHPGDLDVFRAKLAQLRDFQMESRNKLEQIHKAAATVTKLAHEHRQSKLSEAAYIHFTQIQILYGILHAIIYQNVLDPTVRQTIGEQIDVAMKKVFSGVKPAKG